MPSNIKCIFTTYMHASSVVFEWAIECAFPVCYEIRNVRFLCVSLALLICFQRAKMQGENGSEKCDSRNEVKACLPSSVRLRSWSLLFTISYPVAWRSAHSWSRGRITGERATAMSPLESIVEEKQRAALASSRIRSFDRRLYDRFTLTRQAGSPSMSPPLSWPSLFQLILSSS